jgi:O-methyltransferase involved in polyketide biosynthesis
VLIEITLQRSNRLHGLFGRSVRFFELDLAEHPGQQRYKRRQLDRNGIISDHVTYLPINFMNESVATVLTRSGHDANTPTLFLW